MMCKSLFFTIITGVFGFFGHSYELLPVSYPKKPIISVTVSQRT